jgi:hypothetical protein
MAAGRVDCVLTGADRIAANGDTANKIGTYALAVAAAHHRIPLYVVAPTSTLDGFEQGWPTKTGQLDLSPQPIGLVRHLPDSSPLRGAAEEEGSTDGEGLRWMLPWVASP